MTGQTAPDSDPDTGALGVFWVFLRLGLTSFGGPVAHLGYFRAEFVERRGWLSDAAYADLVALSQFLPGPASSQTGFALGLMRGGWAGGLAAWLGFTLPSALVLVAFGLGAGALDGPVAAGVIDGLKVLAVAVVAHAVLGMARSLCPDLPRQIIALVALAALAVLGGPLAQLAVIGLGGLAGLALGGMPAVPETGGGLQGGPGRRAGLLLMGLAVGLFVAGPLMLAAGIGGQGLALFEAFYRAGALVFGGGHVVLPLLEASVVAPGWVTPEAFLAGYGATQAVPGPIFAFAGYLGAVSGPAPNGIAGAAIALVAIFLPGLLLMAGMLPFWQALRGRPRARAVLAGVNAAVVGVLAAALFDPVFLAGIGDRLDFALGAAAFVALVVWRVPVVAVVAATALAGGLRGLAGI